MACQFLIHVFLLWRPICWHAFLVPRKTLKTTVFAQHITSALRTCYVTGDTILIGCLSGHVNIASRENSYKLMTCLGGGRWSDPKPLHCIRRSCGEPQHYNNTVRHCEY